MHLFSHTKGKRHQQAVRDSSSIQGRELSDEEVVRITVTQLGTNKHPLTLPKSIALLLPVSCKKKKNRQRAQSFMTRSLLMFIRPLIYCHRPVAGFVRLQMSLEMYSVKVQRFSGGLTSPSCLQAFLFFVCHGALFHGKAAH